MRVAMVGTGYVGLVSGTCLSEFGIDVTCIDKVAEKIEALRAGKVTIFEPGLENLIASNVAAGRLRFSTDLKAAVAQADAIFIAVGTPSRRGDGHADLSYVYEAAAEIADCLEGYTLVVTKSTVPVATGREVERIIRERRPDADFDVASNPEFLREGAAINDFMRPDRVVVGVETERARDVMREIYRPLFLNETPVLFTSRETAELIKYAANSFLATKITFINEMADLCEKVGADVQVVARGIGLDGRIGSKFLHAGPGYGGSCFPKDTVALARLAVDAGAATKIVETVVAVNEARRKAIGQKIIDACGGTGEGKTVAVLGLTFKPNTDDMREAPSLDVVRVLQEAGATVRAYDPEGMPEAKKQLDDVVWCEGPYETMVGADVVTIITEWNAFRALDFGRMKGLLKTPLLVDLRNIYNPGEMEAAGFDYHSVGRPAALGFSQPKQSASGLLNSVSV
jgi:UDPglucose 6-dehydrogenase